MSTFALALVALGAALAACFVALPLLRGEAAPAPLPDAAELSRLALLEQRDAAITALRELELDYRTGKLADADYERSRGELRAEAVGVLAALESGDGERALDGGELLDVDALEQRDPDAGKALGQQP